MQKELIIATTSQETKIAILENDELVEYLIERHRSQGIVGNIYKGKVTKVLPGMQSAFVDIGLERDAFLYVSDFFEDTEEYDKIVSTVEDEVIGMQSRPTAPPVRQVARDVIVMEAAVSGAEDPTEAAAEPAVRPATEVALEGISMDPSIGVSMAANIDTSLEPLGVSLLGAFGESPTVAPSPAESAPGVAETNRPPAGPAPHRSDAGFDRRGPRRRDRDRGERDEREDRGSREGRPERPEVRADRPEYRNDRSEVRGPRPDDRGARDTAGDRDRGGGDRGGDRDRGGRDRGGKPRPRIPSFEPRTHEPRTHEPRAHEPRTNEQPRADDRSYGGIEALPGETLAKHRRPAVPPAVEPSRAQESASSSRLPSAPIDEAIQPAPAAPEGPSRSEFLTERPTETAAEPDADARISDQSHNRSFAHRPPGRRPRRQPDDGAPPKTESPRSNGSPQRGGATIAELLREGQEILVQVSKEPLGKKGARITSHIAMPGRYLVYMPTVDHVGVSRKIASDEERQRLKRIINEHRNGLPGGFIVRTAAEGRSEAEFVQDIRFLGNLWADIRVKSEKKSAPALIHRDLNLVQRLLRDQLSQDFTAIRLDNEPEFATVLDFVNKFQPALVNRVKLHLKDTPIFEEFGLNAEIDKALRPKVWMKSGGYIVINQTEALVAIDVNTGKFVGRSNRLEDTIVRTNLDAVHEIVRQIRLRNLGGIIVVDFIDMEEKKNRQRVMTALEEEIRSDKVPSKILQFNDFGLVAITRKRTQPSLERTICAPCSRCNGSGWLKSPESVCYEIQQEMKKMVATLEGKEVTIRVNPEVAKALKSGQFVAVQDLEEWLRKDIVVKSDPLLHEEQFDIF